MGSIALQVYAQQMDRLAEEAGKRAALTCVNPKSIEAVHTLGPSTESSPVSPVDMETEENTEPVTVQVVSFMSLPTRVSSDSIVPLVDQVVRCSPRIIGKKQNMDFPHIRLSYSPKKKQKMIRIEQLKIQENEGKNGPIPISRLQGRGIACGVTPTELTEEALMSAPNISTPVQDEEEA